MFDVFIRQIHQALRLLEPRHHGCNHQVAHTLHHRPAIGPQVVPVIDHLADQGHGRGRVLGHDRLHDATHQFVGNGPEHLIHVVLGNRFAAERHGLIQQTQRVAHTAFTRLGHRPQTSFIDRDADVCHNFLETRNDLPTGNPAKVEMLAAGRDRRRDFVDFSRRKDKHRVRRGLFQCLQERVERRIGEHVDFVDDVDPIGAPERRKFDVFTKFPDVVHAGIRGAVDLDDVNRVAARNFQTTLALPARLRGRTFFAIQRLGQDTRGRGLAHAAHAGEEIRMGHLLAEDRVPQRLHDVRLPDQLFECARTKFSGGNLVFHHSFLRLRSGLRLRLHPASPCFTVACQGGHAGPPLLVRIAKKPGPGDPVAHRLACLPLLPSGPGGVHKILLHRAQPLSVVDSPASDGPCRSG